MADSTQAIADLESRNKALSEQLETLTGRVKSLESRRLLIELVGAAVVVGIFVAFGWEPRTIARNIATDVATSTSKDIASTHAKEVARDAADQVTKTVFAAAEKKATDIVSERVPGLVSDTVKKELGISTIAEIEKFHGDAKKLLADAKTAKDQIETRLKDLTAGSKLEIGELETRGIKIIDEKGTVRAIVGGNGIDLRSGDVRTTGKFIVYHPAKGDLIWMQNYGDTGGSIIVRDPVAKKERIELRGDHTGAFLNFIDNVSDKNRGVLQRQVDGTVTIYMFKLKDIPEK